MSQQENQPRFSTALALRQAGYVRLPALWIKATDMPQIHAITDQHADAVNAIRGRVQLLRKAHQQAQQELAQSELPPDDPRINKASAWEAYERARGGN